MKNYKKSLRPLGLKDLKLKPHNPHGLCILLDFFTLYNSKIEHFLSETNGNLIIFINW